MLHDLSALAPYGADGRVQALVDSYVAATDRPGRVVRVERDRCTVATAGGVVAARGPALPAVGDWVAVGPPAPTATDEIAPITAVLAPRSELRRGEQVVAANVDVVFVVAGLDRPLNIRRLERELTLAWESGARPVVVLTKADRSPLLDVDDVADQLGLVDVVLASGVAEPGADALAAELAPGRTGVLLGASGVGKSTLVNRLLGDDVAATGAVREHDRRGRHTTTNRSLLPLPGGGVIIDGPGVRSLSVAGADEGIARTFPEIEELAGACRFRDCAHEGEPGCAVEAAVGDGRLDLRRLESWRKLRRELAFEARRVDPRLAAEERRRWKVVHKAVRGRSRP